MFENDKLKWESGPMPDIDPNAVVLEAAPGLQGAKYQIVLDQEVFELREPGKDRFVAISRPELPKHLILSAGREDRWSFSFRYPRVPAFTLDSGCQKTLFRWLLPVRRKSMAGGMRTGSVLLAMYFMFFILTLIVTVSTRSKDYQPGPYRPTDMIPIILVGAGMLFAFITWAWSSVLRGRLNAIFMWVHAAAAIYIYVYSSGGAWVGLALLDTFLGLGIWTQTSAFVRLNRFWDACEADDPRTPEIITDSC